MRTVINTRFIATDAKDRFETILKNSPRLSTLVEYDSETGIILVDSDEKTLIKAILSHIGGRYPMSFVVGKASEDEMIVRNVYASLSDNDKIHVQIVPADTGSRLSIFVDQFRDDIQAKFWEALYPSSTVSDIARGARTREFPEINIKLPQELKATAMAHGDWTQMIVREDGLYVTEELLRILREKASTFVLDKVCIRSSTVSREGRTDSRTR